MANLRDTEDGINEAGWEKAMQEDIGYCEVCKREGPVFQYCGTLDPSDTLFICGSCHAQKQGFRIPSAD